MGRSPCCSKVGILRGQWTSEEDALLTSYIHSHGEGNWRSLPKKAGLLRCGKSCRLRWVNYLRPDIKRGNISPEEEDLIIRLHSLLGNRWSLIAGRLPGRTDNEIKNYWNSQLSKKLKKQGLLREEDSPPRRGPKRHGDCRSGPHMRNISSSSSSSKAGDHELYAPKAIRLAPSRSMGWNCNSTSSVTDHNSKEEEEEEAAVAAGSGDPTCSGYSDDAAGADNHIFESGNYLGVDFDLNLTNCDLHLHDHAVFDSLFQEYSQLLHSDMDPDFQFMDPFSDSAPMLQY